MYLNLLSNIVKLFYIIYFQKLVNEVKQSRDPTYDRHFLDMYLTKMEQEYKEKERSTYSSKYHIML